MPWLLLMAPSPLDYGLSGPPSAMLPPSTADTNTVGPGSPASQLPPTKPASTIAECPTASKNNPADSDNMECLQLPPITATYYVGDSIVRQLTIPGAI